MKVKGEDQITLMQRKNVEMKEIAIFQISEAAKGKLALHEEKVAPRNEEAAPLEEITEEKEIGNDEEMVDPEELKGAQVPKKLLGTARVKGAQKGEKESKE